MALSVLREVKAKDWNQQPAIPPRMSGKSLVPYRQCSACTNFRLPMLLARSSVDTAICAKPLARWTYGDWMSPAGS